MKTKLLGVVAACLLAVTVGTANASTFNLSVDAVFFVTVPTFHTGVTADLDGSITVTDAQLVGGAFSATWSKAPQDPANKIVAGWWPFPVSGAPGSSPSFLLLLTSGSGSWQLTGSSTNSFRTGFALTFPGDLLSYNGEAPLSGQFTAGGEQCGPGIGQCGDILYTLDLVQFQSQFSVVPLPAALPLFATGLGALGLLGWRRKRKNAAVTPT